MIDREQSRWFYTIDGTFDLNRMGEVDRELSLLGIKHGTNDWMVGFETQEDHHNALKALWRSEWKERWAVGQPLVKLGFITQKEYEDELQRACERDERQRKYEQYERERKAIRERDHNILDVYTQQGWSVKKIGEWYDMDQKAVRELLKKYKIRSVK